MLLLVGILSGCTEETTNNKPVAVFISTADGLTVEFIQSSTDADEDTLTYAWDFGDELGTSTEENPTYAYAASGTYTVTLTVNDGTEDSDPVTAEVTVTNPPMVTLGDLPETITNETAITFEATATEGDATINATTGYTWEIDDVAQEGTTATFVHTFTEDGTYVVKVTVTDEDGLTAEATVTVTVPTTAEE